MIVNSHGFFWWGQTGGGSGGVLTRAKIMHKLLLGYVHGEGGSRERRSTLWSPALNPPVSTRK